jgi:hypothetical protein
LANREFVVVEKIEVSLLMAAELVADTAPEEGHGTNLPVALVQQQPNGNLPEL